MDANIKIFVKKETKGRRLLILIDERFIVSLKKSRNIKYKRSNLLIVKYSIFSVGRKKLHKTVFLFQRLSTIAFFLEINIKVQKEKKEIRREMSCTGIKHPENPFLIFTSNIQSMKVQLIWKEEWVEKLEKENRQLLILNGEKLHNVHLNCQLCGTLKSTWITGDMLRWSRGKRKKNGNNRWGETGDQENLNYSADSRNMRTRPSQLTVENTPDRSTGKLHSIYRQPTERAYDWNLKSLINMWWI